MDNFIAQRAIFPSVRAHLESAEITVIVGPRQAGKTTLVKQLRDDLAKTGQISEQNIFYFNLDVLTDKRIFVDQTTFVQFVKNRIKPNVKLYVFVDEAQRIDNPGIFFKGVYDLNLPLKLVLTGSSSLEIKAKIFEPLTGRKRVFTLFPFSFGEYLLAIDPQLAPLLGQDDPLASPKIREHLLHFLVWGGYPKVALTSNLAEKISYLEEIYTSYVEKDIVGLVKIKDPWLFTKFVAILAQETGNLFNTEGASQELRMKNDTVRKYLRVLEETFVIKRVPPYFHSARTEIRKMPKVYFLDNGLLAFARDKSSLHTDFPLNSNQGQLLENFVFSELLKSGANNLNFWRTKDDAEVDFVLEQQGLPVPIEIKTKANPKDGLTRSFSSFLDRYRPPTGYIVNLEKEGQKTVGPTKIKYLYPETFLTVLDK